MFLMDSRSRSPQATTSISAIIQDHLTKFEELQNAPSTPFTENIFTKGSSESQLELSTRESIKKYCQNLFPSLCASKSMRIRQSVPAKERRDDIKKEMVYLLNTLYCLQDESGFTTEVGHVSLDTEKPFEFMLLVLRGMIDKKGYERRKSTSTTIDLHAIVSSLDELDARVANLEVRAVYSSPRRRRKIEREDEELTAALSSPAVSNEFDEDAMSTLTDDFTSTTITSSNGQNCKGILQESLAKIYSAALIEYSQKTPFEEENKYQYCVIVKNLIKSFSAQSLNNHQTKKKSIAHAYSVLYGELKEFIDMLIQSGSSNNTVDSNSSSLSSENHSKSTVIKLLDKHSKGAYVYKCEDSTEMTSDKSFFATAEVIITFTLTALGEECARKKEAQACAAEKFLRLHSQLLQLPTYDEFKTSCGKVHYEGLCDMSIGNSSSFSSIVSCGKNRVDYEKVVKRHYDVFKCDFQYSELGDSNTAPFKSEVTVKLRMTRDIKGTEQPRKKDADNSTADAVLKTLSDIYKNYAIPFDEPAGTSARQKVDNFILKLGEPSNVKWIPPNDNVSSSSSTSRSGSVSQDHSFVSRATLLLELSFPVAGTEATDKRQAKLNAIEAFCIARCLI